MTSGPWARTGRISDLLEEGQCRAAGPRRPQSELHRISQPRGERIIGPGQPLASAIDAFLASILAVPGGATRSAYTSAILRERLHDGSIACVVLVKGVGGSTAEVVNDKPLWFKDKFTTIASSGLSWLLIAAADGAVVAGGSKVSTLEITGTIGDTIKVKPPTILPT